MTDPAQDDSWDELARELGVEKSSSPADSTPPVAKPTPEPERLAEDDSAVGDFEGEPTRSHRRRHAADIEDFQGEEAEVPGGEEAVSDEGESDFDEGGEPEGEASDTETGAAGEGTPEEGQPGPGRKRRRRRRRRKKGGQAAGAPSAEATEPAGNGVEADEEAVATHGAGDEYAEGEWEEPEEEGGVASLAAEEDTGGEVLRELIANWNVPSWDEIVSGLYRPER